MGNFGGLITAHATSLGELMESAGIATGDHRTGSALDLTDGWQSVFFPDGDDLDVAVRAVADATSAPAIGAQFLDSDTGLVSGVTQPGTHWGWAGILDPHNAR